MGRGGGGGGGGGGGAAQRAKRQALQNARIAEARAHSNSAVFVRKEAQEAKFTDTSAGLLDWQIYRAAQTPGPGEYGSRPLPLPGGGRFSRFKPKGYADDMIKRGLGTPGPADYPAPKMPATPGGRFNASKPKTELEWIEYYASQLPGPADIPAPLLPKPSGGRFSTANPKSDVDWLMYRAAQMPGPTDYLVPPPPGPHGGTFNKGKSKTNLDWIELRAGQLPGPGQYGVGVSDGPLKLSGGKFNESRPKSELDWIIYRSTQMPGPGQYDPAKSLDSMFKSPSCRLLGRTGQKSLHTCMSVKLMVIVTFVNGLPQFAQARARCHSHTVARDRHVHLPQCRIQDIRWTCPMHDVLNPPADPFPPASKGCASYFFLFCPLLAFLISRLSDTGKSHVLAHACPLGSAHTTCVHAHDCITVCMHTMTRR
jgi:hypothetical protein